MLPVYIVDDEETVITECIEDLALAYPGRKVVGIRHLGQAAVELMKLDEPFVLVLDHDFGSLTTETLRHGSDLALLLRRRHPWGLLLPIYYRSGRFNDRGWHNLPRENGPFIPSAFVTKGDVPVTESVAELDRLFAQARDAWLRQSEILANFFDYNDFEEYDIAETDGSDS